MALVKVIVEKASNNYSAFIDGLDGIAVMGDSMEEIRTRIKEAIELYVDGCKEFDMEVPEILSGDYELQFYMDVESFINFYEGILSKAGLERLTGINQKQLWHYASGKRKPREESVRKIQDALHKLGEELLSIQL